MTNNGIRVFVDSSNIFALDGFRWIIPRMNFVQFVSQRFALLFDGLIGI